MSRAQRGANQMQALHKKTYDVAPYLPASFEEITHAEPAPSAIAVSHLPSMSPAQRGANRMQALHNKTNDVAPYLLNIPSLILVQVLDSPLPLNHSSLLPLMASTFLMFPSCVVLHLSSSGTSQPV